MVSSVQFSNVSRSSKSAVKMSHKNFSLSANCEIFHILTIFFFPLSYYIQPLESRWAKKPAASTAPAEAPSNLKPNQDKSADSQRPLSNDSTNSSVNSDDTSTTSTSSTSQRSHSGLLESRWAKKRSEDASHDKHSTPSSKLESGRVSKKNETKLEDDKDLLANIPKAPSALLSHKNDHRNPNTHNERTRSNSHRRKSRQNSHEKRQNVDYDDSTKESQKERPMSKEALAFSSRLSAPKPKQKDEQEEEEEEEEESISEFDTDEFEEDYEEEISQGRSLSRSPVKTHYSDLLPRTPKKNDHRHFTSSDQLRTPPDNAITPPSQFLHSRNSSIDTESSSPGVPRIDEISHWTSNRDKILMAKMQASDQLSWEKERNSKDPFVSKPLSSKWGQKETTHSSSQRNTRNSQYDNNNGNNTSGNSSSNHRRLHSRFEPKETVSNNNNKAREDYEKYNKSSFSSEKTTESTSVNTFSAKSEKETEKKEVKEIKEMPKFDLSSFDWADEAEQAGL